MSSEYTILLLELGGEGESLSIYGRTDGDPRVQKPETTHHLPFDNEDPIVIPAEEYPAFEAFWQTFTNDHPNWFRLQPLFIHNDVKPVLSRHIAQLNVPEMDALKSVRAWKAAILIGS